MSNPIPSSSRRSLRRSSGGDCCGSGSTDASTRSSERPSLAFTKTTAMSLQRQPWSTRTPSHDRSYHVRDGAPIMDDVGKRCMSNWSERGPISSGRTFVVRFVYADICIGFRFVYTDICRQMYRFVYADIYFTVYANRFG
ncbi:hypothetical protein L7F22_025347 [Adiantum nelumboides]|nr:hypothetical protein [Adiantum nelumboides]